MSNVHYTFHSTPLHSFIHTICTAPTNIFLYASRKENMYKNHIKVSTYALIYYIYILHLI